MSLIECRNCDAPDCAGCNIYRLSFALRRGLFDSLKDEHNTVQIGTDVVEVVRCRDCKHRYVGRDNVRFNLCMLNHNRGQPDGWFCADGERKDGDA